MKRKEEEEDREDVKQWNATHPREEWWDEPRTKSNGPFTYDRYGSLSP